MLYAVCEQRPKHYSIRLAPMPVKAIDLEAPYGDTRDRYSAEEMLEALQSVGVGGALVPANLLVNDNGVDYIIEYREASHHYSQSWLRLVPLPELGKRIYMLDETDR